MWEYTYTVHPDELYHYGVLGMKWGVRKKRQTMVQKRVKSIDRKADEEIKRIKQKAKVDKKLSKARSRAERRIQKVKRKHGIIDEPVVSKPKTIKDMSDDELRAKVARLRLENDYKSLNPQKVSKGKKFVNDLGDIAVGALKTNGQKIIGDYLTKQLNKSLGIDTKNSLDSLRKQSEELELRAKMARNADYLDERKKKGLA